MKDHSERLRILSRTVACAGTAAKAARSAAATSPAIVLRHQQIPSCHRAYAVGCLRTPRTYVKALEESWNRRHRDSVGQPARERNLTAPLSPRLATAQD